MTKKNICFVKEAKSYLNLFRTSQNLLDET